MWVIVGLGNPGARYAKDRHNIGFDVIDWISRHHQIPVQKTGFQSLYGKGEWDGLPVVLVKPQTYMNLSGEAVAPLCRYFEVSPQQVLVVHDDLDLAFGRLRLKQGGGDGGQRGVRSISACLEDRDFLRLRVGIGRPADPEIAIADYVLSPFATDQQTHLPAYQQRAAAMALDCCRQGIAQAMNYWHAQAPPWEDTAP